MCLWLQFPYARLTAQACGHAVMLPSRQAFAAAGTAARVVGLRVFHDLFFPKVTLFDKYQVTVANVFTCSAARV